ncbi:hypothetical protein SAMD00019534_091850, partial [Acytostelium subglobosum LB1]|uniref:hypothetical protein n=1 Tax=Acytostelium subglobosum LB1 TaxID=1410327 RepID=UPI0006450E75
MKMTVEQPEANVHVALTHLELTTVHYDMNDPQGLIWAYITLIPLIIVVSVATLVIFKRDLRTGSLLGGLLVSEAINYVLKKSIKEGRPTHIQQLRKKSYGMPSDHAQFMFFFALLVTMFMVKNKTKICKHIKRVLIVVLFTLALAVAYSRVHLGYHTDRQVAYGSVIGMTLAMIWYGVTEYIFVPFIFPLLADSPIGRYFYLRDTTLIPNLMQFEYNNSLKEISRLKQQGSSSQSPNQQKKK